MLSARAVRDPLLVPGLLVILGVLWGSAWVGPAEPALWGALGCAGLTGVAVACGARCATLAAWAACLLVGFASPRASPPPLALEGRHALVGEVQSASGRRLLLEVSQRDGRPVRGRVRVDLAEAGPGRGDRLAVFGRTVPLLDPTLPGAQDPAALARGQGVVARVRAQEAVVLGPERQAPSMFAAAEHGGVLRALAFGDRAGVGEATNGLLRRTGTRHLLAISGLHVGLVAALGALLGRVCSRPLLLLRPALGAGVLRWLPVLTGLALGWAYTGLAAGPVSARRALVMVAGALAGAASGRGIRPWNLLGGAALALGLAAPWEVRGLAFGLSFSAVAGILWVTPRWTALLPPDLPRPVGWAWGSVGATLGATLGTLPLVAWVFQELALTAPLANLVAVPLVGGVAVPAALMAVVGVPGAEGVANLAVGGALAWLRLVDGPVLSPAVGPIGAALLALAVLAFRRPGLSVAFGLGACLQVRPVGVLTATFLAVGQGDAVLVSLPGGERILVDGGPPSRRVLHWLRREGITHLDEVVLSHPHPDHGGGLLPVVEGLSVGALRVPRLPRADEDAFVALWLAAQARGVPLVGPHEPSLPGVEVLHPAPSFLQAHDDVNETSVVLRVTHGRSSLLLTGDVERAGEAALVAGGLDHVSWLKVAHHGSRTSSTEEFVDAVRPRVAVAQSGIDNRFRHPRPAIVSRWRRAGAQVLRTDTHGTIELRSDGMVETWRHWLPGPGWSPWRTLQTWTTSPSSRADGPPATSSSPTGCSSRAPTCSTRRTG